MGVLQRNIEALYGINSRLCERLQWAIDPSGLQEVGNQLRYRFRNQLVSLEILREGRERITHTIQEAKSRGEQSVLLAGMGDGDWVMSLLKAEPHLKLVVWERDPALMQAALMRHEFGFYIKSGQLRLLMNSDLLREVSSLKTLTCVPHPFLGERYANELACLTQGLKERRVLLCESQDETMEDATEILHAQEASCFTFDPKRIALEEIALLIRDFAPQMIFSLQYILGLAEICEEHRIKLICWESDVGMASPKRFTASSLSSFIFSCSRTSCASFFSSGFENVHRLPYACSAKRYHKPAVMPPAGQGVMVSYVGESLMSGIQRHRNQFVTLYTKATGISEKQAQANLESILQRQDSLPHEFMIPELCQEVVGDTHLRQIEERVAMPEFYGLAAEIASAHKRFTYLRAVADKHTLHLYGDEGLRKLDSPNAHYQGTAESSEARVTLYSSAQINLDIAHIYHKDLVSRGVFECIMSGGFMLAERTDAIDELFEVGFDIEAFSTLEELSDKVAYYLKYPEKARQIAQLSYQKVMEDHTLEARMRHMMKKASLNWDKKRAQSGELQSAQHPR